MSKPTKPEDAASLDHSQRIMYTFMVGVYLATNAIKDAFTMVEGPDCTHLKSQYVQGNHDWLSTLTSVSGHHRIANTALHPHFMAKSREAAIETTLKKIASHPVVGGVFMTSMPMAVITGADYERLCRGIQQDTGKTVIHVQGKSLSGDWMDGYQEVLVSLARQLDLSGGTPKPRQVAIIGHLYDRNEGDQRANVAELKRILAALDLDPVSIWLCGDSFADLSKVKDAEAIILLPYGKKAATWLAKRTGARLIHCDLPFGLEATEQFVRQLGAEFGCSDKAEAFIDQELAKIVPSLEFLIPYVFQNRRVGYLGDPHLAKGFAQTARLLGLQLDFAIITNPRAQAAGLDKVLEPQTHLLIYPRLKPMLKLMRERITEHRLALLVSNTAGIGMVAQEGLASVEFGFPSFHTHCLADRPFLGFAGVLPFIDNMANALRMAEVAHWTNRYWQGLSGAPLGD
ncbi:MAG TPA: nitrogenase component 1 [Myxococcota bacterium]|nr:nitrogenase component 1 [Myxococcota bacterium]HON25501.1 nitrogenase component 1 [Myxococcota bacterium]HOS62445.1 nitrogenase component 1 [Myxococcota bacterium]HPC91974.1 nitrogenase component 1 [Myxococcota bacterium]HPL26142.1 nitrogenase component 1 [Myxococcota bacterium]